MSENEIKLIKSLYEYLINQPYITLMVLIPIVVMVLSTLNGDLKDNKD